MNGLSVCLNEIALEGLDGITISTLWRRIDSAALCSTVDENYKEFLWRCVSSCQDIEAYLLETPRAEVLSVTDDSKVYPYYCINESGIRGSCATFKTRSLLDVSDTSLQTAVETYGNRLVLVASQLLRNKVLLGTEFDVSVKIPETCYCLLEMIGRARKLGRLHSNLGLQTMVDSRSLFSQVKTLLKLQLITKQPVIVATKRNLPSSIVYLARYHIEHSCDSIQFKISEALCKAPDCCMPLESLYSLLGEQKEIVERVVEELSKSGHVQFVNNSDAVSHDVSEIVSGGDSSEKLYDTQELLGSGDNKVIRFVHHFYNLCVEGGNELEDEEWMQPEKQELSMSIPAEVPIMHAVYHFIESKGTQGVSLTQCCQELSFPFFDMRKILKDMECQQVLFCKFQDIGNTKQNIYFARSTLPQGLGHLSQTSGSSALHSLKPTLMQNTETTHPPANPTIQAEMSATQITEDQMSQITQPSSSQAPYALTTEIMQPHAACITQPPLIQKASTSTQITKPQTSQGQGSENTIVTITENEHVVLQNPAATVEENIIYDTTQLSTNDVDDTTSKPKKSVRSRSQKFKDSEKFIRRKESIVNLLKNLKVVEGRNLFARVIRMEEKKMGLNITVDRRSVTFLLDRLAADGLLKRVEMNVKVEDDEHKVELFYDISIQDSSDRIASCVQKFKDRIAIKKAKRSGVLGDNKTAIIGAFLPKMPRVEILHMFLFYVIYELSNPNVDLEAMRQKYGWAEQLKPEHVPKNIGKGWFTPFSILMICPVSLYIKLVDTSFHNFVVQQYFDNPATRHMLLKDLPALARQILFDNRRSHFLFGSFEFLAHFGLITPTNRQIFFHERDIACYLHTSTVVMDTRESEPSYDEVKHPEEGGFLEKQFSFAGMADVEQYWDTVRNVCMTTPLNRRKPHDSKSRLYATFESFVVDQKEIPTCSKPRGDGLGAAGFDSRLYVHLPGKWKWSLVEKQTAGLDSDVEDALDWQLCFTNNDLVSEKVSVASVRKKKTKRKQQKPAEDESVKKKRKVIDEKKTDVSHHDTKGSSAQRTTSTAKNNCSTRIAKNVDKGKKRRRRRKRKKLEPKVNTAKAKPKSHSHWSKFVHDKRDEEALKQLQAKRNTFTPQQQKLLFICCLALRIIGKKSVDTGYSDWLWTRDILYKDNYESAKTKTALSICRKYRSMVSNAQTKRNLNICVADCMQDKEFQPYCNIGKNCNEAMFNELVELLKKRYSMENMVSNRLVLPSTTQEFQQQKNLYNNGLEVENSEKCDEDILSLEPRETSVADIRQRIIRDSIVSALLLNNVSYQSHVAFRFLSQFTEEELIIAISVLKNGRIVVRKQLRYAKSGSDLASCAFSQMLSNHGQRIIDNHFPSSLLDDAKSFYDEVTNASKSLEHIESSEQFLPLKFSESSFDGGKVYCIFSLLSCQRLAVNMEVPDVFLALAKGQNSKKSKPAAENVNEELRTEVNNETIEECCSSNISHAYIPHDPSESCKNGEDKASKETCGGLEPEFSANKERNPSNGSDAFQTSTISSEQLRENTNVTTTIEKGACQSTSQTTNVQGEDAFPDEETVTIPGNVNRKRSNDMVLDVLCGIEDHLFGSLDLESNTPLYKVNLKPTSTFTCCMTTSDINSVRTSGSNHVVLRNVETSSLRDKSICESYLQKIATYQRTGDLNRIRFSINPCNIQVLVLPIPEVTSTPKGESLAQSVAHHFKSNELRMPETVEECVTVCSKIFGYSSKDCKALKVVYETINSSKEIGMSSSSVNKIVRSQHSIVRFSIDGLIKVLEAFNLVYQVGFVEVCYVAKAFKKHWFLSVREGDVTSSSEIRRLEEEPTCSGKRKRSVSQEETNVSCTKSGVSVESGLPEIGEPDDVMILDNTTSPIPPERTVSRRTRSITARSRADDKQKSKETRNSSSANDNSRKQTSRETQTDNYSSKPCRPWITMAGEMNKNAYNTLHRSVLAYIIKYPGVQKYTITKHFVNLIYPVAINDILEKLEDCECIERRICCVKKETLFSSKAGSKSTYYLSKPDAMFKLMEHAFL